MTPSQHEHDAARRAHRATYDLDDDRRCEGGGPVAWGCILFTVYAAIGLAFLLKGIVR